MQSPRPCGSTFYAQVLPLPGSFPAPVGFLRFVLAAVCFWQVSNIKPLISKAVAGILRRRFFCSFRKNGIKKPRHVFFTTTGAVSSGYRLGFFFCTLFKMLVAAIRCPNCLAVMRV